MFVGNYSENRPSILPCRNVIPKVYMPEKCLRVATYVTNGSYSYATASIYEAFKYRWQVKMLIQVVRLHECFHKPRVVLSIFDLISKSIQKSLSPFCYTWELQDAYMKKITTYISPQTKRLALYTYYSKYTAEIIVSKKNHRKTMGLPLFLERLL